MDWLIHLFDQSNQSIGPVIIMPQTAPPFIHSSHRGAESWIPHCSLPLSGAAPRQAQVPSAAPACLSEPSFAPIGQYAFARRMLVRVGATKAKGGGLRGDVKVRPYIYMCVWMF